mgnify:CR=1 FL=1
MRQAMLTTYEFTLYIMLSWWRFDIKYEICGIFIETLENFT